MILLANLVSFKFKINKKLIYIFLVASFLIELILPVNTFVQTVGLIKYVAIPALLNLPLFFSGLLFIQYFNQAKDRRSFYAYNLFGSAVGGLVSYTSYITGISFLIVISLVFYLTTAFNSNGGR